MLLKMLLHKKNILQGLWSVRENSHKQKSWDEQIFHLKTKRQVSAAQAA